LIATSAQNTRYPDYHCWERSVPIVSTGTLPLGGPPLPKHYRLTTAAKALTNWQTGFINLSCSLEVRQNIF